MSIILTASPYVSEEGGGSRKDGKRMSTLRNKKKTYPKPEVEEPLPVYSSYTENKSIDNYSSFQKMSDSFFPSLSTISESFSTNQALEKSKTGNNSFTKNDTKTTHSFEENSPLPSFYKNPPNQQSKLNSALNKLFGKKGDSNENALEGMSNFNPEIEVIDNSLTPNDISNPIQNNISNTGVVNVNDSIPTKPLLSIPTEYLHSSP